MILAALLLAAAEPDAVAGPRAILAPDGTVLLAAGTMVHLTTVDTIDSRSVIQGQRFPLRVAEDVMIDGQTVIPRGAAALGEVEAVSGKGMVGKAGQLVLSPLYVEVAGRRVNLVGSMKERGADSTTGVAVTSLLFTGLGMFITGKSATVPPGSSLSAQVRTDIRVKPSTIDQR